MWKVVYRYWHMFTLPGLILLAAFLLSSGAQILWGWGLPSASAAGHYTPRGLEDCTREHMKPTFGGTLVIESGNVVCSNLTSWGATILIKGEVHGDIVAVRGNVIVDGQVDGTIRSYMGNVTLHNGSRINGDIHLCGGLRSQDVASQLHGSVFDCPRSVALLLADNAGSDFRFWSLLTWVILGILLISLLPEHVMLVRTTIRCKLRRSLSLGVLTILLAPAILAVLAALIISIPLAIIIVLGLIAGWALGTVAVGWLIGEYIVNRVAPQHNTRPVQVIVGLAVLALAGSLPFIGWFISIGAGLLGLGAVFLSRFGTRLYGQPRQPLPL